MRVRSGLNKGARWVAGSSIHGCWLGSYESEKQRLVSKLIRPGMVVWDVGANAGFYTLAFSRMVGTSGAVYAFEPSAENVCNLLRHVHLNSLGNVIVVQVALGASTEIVGFRRGPFNSMGSVSSQARSYLVPSLTVDDFLARNPGARPDLLKIDVEGAEADVLVGASEFLRKASPQIVLELHGTSQTQRCTAILTALDYSLYYLDGAPATDRPLKSDEIHARRDVAQ